MKKTLLGLSLLVSTVAMSQKIITSEEMKTITKGAFETIECDIYVAKDGHSYKVGDTIKIGKPSSNKTFAYISSGSALTGSQPLGVSSSGDNTIIKKIGVGGLKRSGFKIIVTGKGSCGMCPNNQIDFEEAMSSGEIQSLGMTREQAITKLKEGKDLVDLGMMSKEDFEKLKSELTILIMK